MKEDKFMSDNMIYCVFNYFISLTIFISVLNLRKSNIYISIMKDDNNPSYLYHTATVTIK